MDLYIWWKSACKNRLKALFKNRNVSAESFGRNIIQSFINYTKIAIIIEQELLKSSLANSVLMTIF